MFEAIIISNHPENEYNGKYDYINDWNNKPHFKNENAKHFYFYAGLGDVM